MNYIQTKVLLADDDMDDCLLFKDALNEIPIPTSLSIVNDGEELIDHLKKHTEGLPNVLFLDLNMPLKNGSECLSELKAEPPLSDIPIVIMSTSCDDRKANELYEKGAHNLICKPPDFNRLKKAIFNALTLIQKSVSRPSIDDFIITRHMPVA